MQIFFSLNTYSSYIIDYSNNKTFNHFPYRNNYLKNCLLKELFLFFFKHFLIAFINETMRIFISSPYVSFKRKQSSFSVFHNCRRTKLTKLIIRKQLKKIVQMLNDNIFLQFLFAFKRSKIILFNIGKAEDHIKLKTFYLYYLYLFFFSKVNKVFSRSLTTSFINLE